MKIAILGIEGTGKAQLAQALTRALSAQSPGCRLVVATNAAGATGCDVILLMGLGESLLANNRDPNGTCKRSQDDALLRQALQTAQLNFVVIYGQGAEQIERALQAILQVSAHRTNLAGPPNQACAPWQWPCDKCSDGACEHRLFTRLLQPDAA